MAAPWAGGAQVRILGKIQGQDCINVLHFATNTQVNDPIDWQPLLLALATAVLACVADQLLPGVTEDYILTGVDARNIAPFKGDPVFVAAVNDSTGALSPCSVSFAASLVNLRSTRGGRRGHGKVFLPPPGETETQNSLMNPPTQAQIAAFILCMVGKFVGQGATEAWRWGVFSPTINAQLIGGGFDNAFAELTQAIPNNKLAVIRSRKVGSGS